MAGEQPSKPSDVSAKAAQEARLEARRNSLAGRDGTASRPTSEVASPRVRKPAKLGAVGKVGGVALLLILLGIGGFFGLRAQRAGSPEGRTRRNLSAYELAGRNVAAQDAACAELDKLGAPGLDLVVSLLTDGQKVEQDGSRSDRPFQQVANAYLLRLAQVTKIDPPPLAVEIKKALFDGGILPAAKWSELQGAWRAWVDAARAKGALPKT